MITSTCPGGSPHHRQLLNYFRVSPPPAVAWTEPGPWPKPRPLTWILERPARGSQMVLLLVEMIGFLSSSGLCWLAGHALHSMDRICGLPCVYGPGRSSAYTDCTRPESIPSSCSRASCTGWCRSFVSPTCNPGLCGDLRSHPGTTPWAWVQVQSTVDTRVLGRPSEDLTCSYAVRTGSGRCKTLPHKSRSALEGSLWSGQGQGQGLLET